MTDQSRSNLAIPDQPHVGPTTYDAKDPDTTSSPRGPFRQWLKKSGFEYLSGFLGGETNQ
jgi:hypothetical protein